MYESELFGEVFPHRFELTKILRQEESEVKFKEALNMMAGATWQVRRGRCDVAGATTKLSAIFPIYLESFLPVLTVYQHC